MKAVNVKYEKADLMCDRSSILGNPYHIGKDGTRNQVIKKYKHYLWHHIQKKDKVYQMLINLSKMPDDTKLGCHCKPLPCHVDIIIKAVKWLKKEKSKQKIGFDLSPEPLTANLLRITSPYFCAGLELKKRPEFNVCAPIIHYMKTWNWKRIKNYTTDKGWKLEKVA